MSAGWTHLGTSVGASFLASVVECVEALTVILAVGSVRGWKSALAGCGAAVALLCLIVLLAGRALLRVPLGALQFVVGSLLVLFGLRWLRKAILRSAGLIALHDESAAFAKNKALAGLTAGTQQGLDKVAFASAFNITMLEGTEVVFIVIAIGAGGTGMLFPASVGALAALVVVTLLGVVVHRPLARVPENALKFTVGVLLSAFGTFWVGEGLKVQWPGSDWSIVGLAACYLALAGIMVPVCRQLGRSYDSGGVK